MNTGIDVAQIQRFGALYIAAARLRSMAKWKSIIAAVDIGNPLFYLIAVGVGIGVLVEKGSGTSGTSGIKYIAFIAPALLANSAIAGVMDETIFPTIEGFKWRKLFFAQNATPITGRQIALGVYLSALCRAIFSVSIYYVLLIAFNVVEFGPSILLIPSNLQSVKFFPSWIHGGRWCRAAGSRCPCAGRPRSGSRRRSCRLSCNILCRMVSLRCGRWIYQHGCQVSALLSKVNTGYRWLGRWNCC